MLDAWVDAARAFDDWAHDRLRHLIDRFDPPDTALADAPVVATADADLPTLSRAYGRLLRAQLAVRDDQPDAALAWLDSVSGPTPPTPDPAGDTDLHRLLRGERAVAAAYVTANVQQAGVGGGDSVDAAWRQVAQAPAGFLGDRQRARAALLCGVWCGNVDDDARARGWFETAQPLARVAGMTGLALQAAMAYVTTTLAVPDSAARACGPADAETLARAVQARQAMDAAQPLLRGAPAYLTHTFTLNLAELAAEEGRCDEALALCDTLLAAGVGGDQRSMAALARARALARVGRLDEALAAIDTARASAQTDGLRMLEQAACRFGALLAQAAGRPVDEVRLLRADRRLRALLQSDAAARRARLGGVRLATERARREAADARAQALQLRLENAALQRQAEVLAEAARTDALTGLDNRLSFDQRLAEAHARAVRVRRPACLALLDIDHFKRVNDRLGHAAGDAVLRRLAGVLRAGVRPGDRVARLGGEEFAILFARVGPAQARAACERLRLRVQSLDWSAVAPGLGVTVSLGLVDTATCASPQDAVADADRRLYAAKRAGRNRVHDRPVAAVQA